MEMECPHLTVHRKALIKGIIRPGNGGFPCSIDEFWVFATGAGLHLLIYECCKLQQWSQKGSHSMKWGCIGKDHEITRPTRHRVDEIVASFFLYRNKTISSFSSGKKIIGAFDLNLCQLISTNIGNISKITLFPLRVIEMACNENHDTFLEHPVFSLIWG